ncbi:2OG-Fe(II) oxygenase [Burkholderia sp. Bp9142]|uniref:2OG-Fe(II) oxygenase n=1 Tax=Burkholderia sp. Bp9142 TaxID=2184573 RepID=UPI000F5B4881|nr:2OG-Fe(II) oxygenase [Burkholderia sp. Bp9142]RQR40635.1 hypothetical protein DIE22_05080 [Burkholderia sp. Bp9142]
MNAPGSPFCRVTPSASVEICVGLIARLLFLPEPRPAGRPSFAEFLFSPAMRYDELKNLGVDSLAWMTLLTDLEDLLRIRFDDALLLADTISVNDVAQVMAEVLHRDEASRDLPGGEVRRASSCGERYWIIDDFLSVDEFAALKETMCNAKYTRIASVVSPALDGFALRSSGKVLAHDTHAPPGDPDAPIASILRAVRDTPTVYGRAGEDWTIVSFAFWQYPPGARLGWHNDTGEGRCGEFVLYLHEEWGPSWGGELMLLDRDLGVGASASGNPAFALEAALNQSQSELTAIVPRPNRLVMIKAGTAHFINRVDASAGDARRCSLTGFASKRVRDQLDPESRLERLGVLMGWRPKVQVS